MLFIDAIVVKVRDGQVVNRPIYVVIGVTVNGERDIGDVLAFLETEVACSIMSGVLDRREEQADAKGSAVRDRSGAAAGFAVR